MQLFEGEIAKVRATRRDEILLFWWQHMQRVAIELANVIDARVESRTRTVKQRRINCCPIVRRNEIAQFARPFQFTIRDARTRVVAL